MRDVDSRTHARPPASAFENGGRRSLCSVFSADAAVLLLPEIEALPRRVRARRAPADLERRFARAAPGIRAFRASQRHLYLHRLGTMPSDQGTHGAGRIPNYSSLPTSRALLPSGHHDTQGASCALPRVLDFNLRRGVTFFVSPTRACFIHRANFASVNTCVFLHGLWHSLITFSVF